MDDTVIHIRIQNIVKRYMYLTEDDMNKSYHFIPDEENTNRFVISDIFRDMLSPRKVRTPYSLKAMGVFAPI